VPVGGPVGGRIVAAVTNDLGAMPGLQTLDPWSAQTEPAWLTEPACCCHCRPRYCVLIPLPGTGDTADLLLCAYHLQLSLRRLAAVGAWVVDARNRRLDPADWA